MGTSIATVGVGLSLFGSILSSLGLEEFGDSVSMVGNYVMMAGGALSTLGVLASAVSDKLIAKGY